MKNLSYTQEYFLCAVNEKGNIPITRSEYINACIIVAGIMELIERGYIEYDESSKKKDKIVVSRSWDEALPYLKPLYKTIESYKKPKSMKGIAECYVFGGFTKNKPQIELLDAIGQSLVNAGVADVIQDKRKTRYVPKKEEITRVVEKIRAEFLEDGIITAETACLAAFLDKSSILKKYFSKFEVPQLKKRIKEVRESEMFIALKATIDHIESIIAFIIIAIAH